MLKVSIVLWAVDRLQGNWFSRSMVERGMSFSIKWLKTLIRSYGAELRTKSRIGMTSPNVM